MRFKSIELLNWGPYQHMPPIALDTSDNSPITIIYGNNGRGKTSLFNAIFYVLYGEQKDKFTAGRYANWYKVLENKEFPVKVTLVYESQGKEVKLSRGFDALPINLDSKEVLVSNEYQTMVIDNGPPVNEKNIDSFIRMDLPQEVSKFFLFDGEQLEKVLKGMSDNESTARLPIKDGIESLLGIPSLKYLSDEIEKLANELERKIKIENKNYKEDQTNEEKSRQIDSDIAGYLSDIADMKSRADLLSEQNATLMNELEKFESAQKDVGTFNSLSAEKIRIKGDIENFENLLTGYLSESWYLPLMKMSELKNEEYVRYLENARDNQQKYFTSTARIKELQAQIETNKCGACGNEIHVDTSEINKEIESLESIIKNSTDFENKVGNLEQVSSVWKNIDKNIKTVNVTILDTYKRLRKSKFDLASNEAEILVVESRLKQINQFDLQEKVIIREQNNETLRTLENNIRTQNDKLDSARKLKQQIRKKIIGAEGVKPIFKIKLNYLEQLQEIVEKSIDDYSNSIRQKVEERASEHYVALMKNEDIVGLEISSDYQVWIKHKNLGKKPAGSFGQSLVFVYALIGALIDVSGNGSSWLIDTPISRLDEIRAPSVWEWISQRKRQVIVLPHKNELTPESAKNLLAGKIGREYEIVPLSDDAWSEIKPLASR
jgi:DNA sulfur modification protein DndD